MRWPGNRRAPAAWWWRWWAASNVNVLNSSIDVLRRVFHARDHECLAPLDAGSAPATMELPALVAGPGGRERDARERGPHLALEGGAVGIERDREGAAAAGEVLVELAGGEREDVGGGPGR